MRKNRILGPALAVGLLAGLAGALLIATPVEPASGLAAMRVPSGFTVERAVVAGLTTYPMMGTIDERGRLFLCESSGNTLNNTEMAANPDYRIRLLEDQNGDGIYDRSHIFATKLTLPAGAVFHRGSLYVAAPPDLLRFEDTDGDGVADKREVVVTGWNMSSNAASLHGPIMGPDGYLYLTDGRHGFDITTRDNRKFKGQGSRIWRVRPDGTGLDWLAGGGFDNPVEVIFTAAGETIGTMTYFKDPEAGERDALLHFVEGGVYPKWHAAAAEFKRTGELMPVMTRFPRIAPAGLARYRGASFGTAFRENLFSAQFNPHRVQRHVLTREGATFHTADSDFLTSTDPDFHPTDVIEDADGSLLVLDTGAWFIHGCPISRAAKPEVKGGIYRIRKQGATPVRDPRGDAMGLATMAPSGLARLLADPRPFVQDRVVELLVQAGDGAVTALAAVQRPSAVFALFRIGTPAAKQAVRAALSSPDFHVRVAAARCAGMAADREAVDRLSAMVRKDHPAARRQAAAALGQIGDARAVAPLIDAAANPDDRFVEHSIIYSLMTLGQPAPLTAALRDRVPARRKAALIALDQMDGAPPVREHIAAFLAAPEKELRSAALWVVSQHPGWAQEVVAYLDRRLRDPQLPPEEARAVSEMLGGFLNDAAAQSMVTSLLADRKQILSLLDAIDGSSLKDMPAPWIPHLRALLESGAPDVRLRTAELVRARAIPGLEEPIGRIAADSTAAPALRTAALGAVVATQPRLTPAQFAFLESRIESASDPILRQAAARVLARSAPPREELLAIARKRLGHNDPLVFSTLIECFRSTADEEVGRALTGLLRDSPAALGTLGEERLQRLLAGYPESVKQAAAPLYAQLRNAQSARIEKLRRLEPLLASGGDPGRGRRIFFGEKAACASCHTIGSEGNTLGPDLTGIGAIRSGHDLLEAIVFPSASFVPGHEIYNVDTRNDRLAGIIRSRTADAVVIATGPNGETRVPRSEIRSITASKVSLMPEGFDELLTRTELTDLLAFLRVTRPSP